MSRFSVRTKFSLLIKLITRNIVCSQLALISYLLRLRFSFNSLEDATKCLYDSRNIS